MRVRRTGRKKRLLARFASYPVPSRTRCLSATDFVMPPPASAIPRFRCASSALLRSRKPISTDTRHIHRPKPISSLNLLSSSSAPPRRSRCGANSEGPGSRPEEEALSGLVDGLLRREENKALLDGLEEASARVERAREALADIERREADALRVKEYMRQLQNREAEIAQSQRELLEARAKVEEAQRSLSANTDDSNNSNIVFEDINKEKERLESAKAAVVSSVAGTLASVPIYLYQATSVPQLILDLAVISISCALFGVTFRYTIFNWMHRKLHSGNNYSQVSQDEDVEEKAAVETDTDALLLHDMLNGILTIGTLGHHHHLVPEAYFDSEELLGEDGQVIGEVEEAGFFEVAGEASAAVLKESFKIKLSVEDEEKKIMEVVQVHGVQGSEKILELPLLKEHKEKRQRRRTTLADLLAANAVNDNDSAAKTVPDGTNVRGKQQAINVKNNMQHKKSKGDRKPPATTTTTGKLQTVHVSILRNL
ncbi:hypothetical protein MUK42_06922 [Musa troglodytarum]|uniref:Uncharacterized protein n=1 Tax=Musa troglodytarum TaxID=320322 RepID=A0A9E7H441_9LILI|nr:hypothetical protein MUK42_06922 [Musa troglodytarum]